MAPPTSILTRIVRFRPLFGRSSRDKRTTASHPSRAQGDSAAFDPTTSLMPVWASLKSGRSLAVLMEHGNLTELQAWHGIGPETLAPRWAGYTNWGNYARINVSRKFRFGSSPVTEPNAYSLPADNDAVIFSIMSEARKGFCRTSNGAVS